jgi:cytoskeleton protein RodZ
VQLTERSWLSVEADGRTVYEGTAESGYEETWTAEDSLVLTTGNAGGVSLSFNGEDPVVLGNSGAVRTLNLTPDSDAAALETP